MAMVGSAKPIQWIKDWLDLGGVEQSDANIGDPFDIVKKAGAGLLALVALPGSALVSAIVPDLNANALFVLQVIIAIVTLIFIHYVVTAKDTRAERNGLKTKTVVVYRYTKGERLTARVVITIAALLYGLNFIPAPAVEPDCNLTATVKLKNSTGKKPLTLLLLAGNDQKGYSLISYSALAITIPATSISNYSFTMVWQDGSRSDFDKFSGCTPPMERASRDGEATISLSSR
jgi:hypothetical protein